MEKATILIVDDEPTARNVLQDILEGEGYEVTAVASAVAALKEGEQKNFDLMLTDIKMPGMDGLELVQKFREVNPQIPSVLITGYPNLESVTAAIQQGAHDYIVKPFDKEELCTAVARVLERKALAMEQAKTVPQQIADLTVEPTGEGSERSSNYLTPAEIIVTLQNSELFATLSHDELQTIADLCQEEIYKENETIYEQGERSEKLYAIEEGAIALNRFIRPDGKAFVTIDILREGRVFGWSALIEPHIHTASAICCRLTRVLAINGVELRYLLQRDPRVGFEIMQQLATILSTRVRAGYDALEAKL